MMTLVRCWRVGSAFLFAMVTLALVTMGQTETATVSGLITDDTGAAVPGAEVKLQSVDRGATASGTTNSAGIYVFASLQPGQYQITVHKPGFKQVDFLGLIVNVQDHIEQNVRLQVGSVSESVTVNANDVHINTTDATVSTVVDRQFAENLPMNGRSFQTLIQLTPGVVTVPSNSVDSGQFSVNGQRAASNYWMVDGVSANIGIGMSSSSSPGNGMGGTLGSFSALGGTNSLVSVDAMQEFRIQTSTYAPEFGRTPGGQISIVTRSGTNQFHGTAFEYLRNDLFDANNWFGNSANLRKPTERNNDFGGTVSGPILKNRTFFFFSYEGLRLRLPQTTLSAVPCDDSCKVAGNVRAMAAPAMQPYLNAYPLPNGPEVFVRCDPAIDPACPSTGQNLSGSAQFNTSYSNPATLDAYALRIDHKSPNKTFFGRYNYSPSEIVQRGGGQLNELGVLQTIRITTQTGTLGATWVFSPTVVNDARFNYSRTDASGAWQSDNFGGAVPLTSPPFPNGFNSRNALFALFITSLGTNSAVMVGEQSHNLQRQINVIDSVSVQKGSHGLKFGVDYRRLSPLSANAPYTQDVFFADVPSSQTGSSEFGAVVSISHVTLLFHNLGLFAQDTWRLAPRLTMTYGLRWDLDFAPSSSNGPSLPAVKGYNPNDFSRLTIAPTGTPPFKTTYGNFAPRVGLAYQLSQNQGLETVLRGGFGVFYDLVSSETGTIVGVGDPPFANSTILFGAGFPFSAAQSEPPAIPPATLSQLFVFNPNLKLPYTLEWNVALEQALGSHLTLSASYVAAAGRRLLQTIDVIQPPTNPILAPGIFIDNTAISDYNALQVQFQRRLAHGLQVLGSYAWSHSIDTGSAGSNFLASNAGVPGSNAHANRGPSDFDIRHTFSAGITYDLRAPKINTITSAILSGWSLQSIIQARSAPPVDTSDQNFFFFNGGIFGDVRPDLVPGQPLYLHGPQYPGGKAFNPDAFRDPPVDPITGNPLRQGDVPRNFFRGFGMAQWDFAIHRDFPIHESLKLQFRAEMFNVLNHPNFGQPAGVFTTPTGPSFGQSTQTLGQGLASGNLGGGAFNPLYQIGGPRSIQFALKLMF